MAYDPAGNYSLPPVYHAKPGTTVRSEQHNSPLEDIAQALSSVLVRDGRGGMVGPLNMGNFKITNVAPGTNPSDVATVGQLPFDGPIAPVGSIVDFAGMDAPQGWMLCYGQAISRSSYSELFSVIGTRYGDGNGSTTFNLPDLRGYVVAGKDNMGGSSANRLTNRPGGVNGDVLGDTGGSEEHELTASQNGPHSHGSGSLSAQSAGNHSHNVTGARIGPSQSGSPGYIVEGGAVANPITWTAASAGAHTHNISGTTGGSGSGSPHNNVQPTIILNKIIRVSA